MRWLAEAGYVVVAINEEASLGDIPSLIVDQMWGPGGEVNLGHLIAMKRTRGRAGLGEGQGVGSALDLMGR